NGHSSSLIAGDIWIFGGWDDSSGLNDMWKYSIQGGSWTRLPRSGSWPSSRGGHSVVADAAGRQLFLFGGLADDDGEIFNDLWKFQIKDLTWSQLELMQPVPPARSGHSAVLDSTSKMWIFGGSATWSWWEVLDDLWSCDVQGE
ncbi:gacHH, partial [Symbiodinium pilosum]